MRMTIIPSDGIVNINGQIYDSLDLSWMDPNIHVVQWYDTVGEIEWKEPHPYMLMIVRNEPINNIDAFQPAIDAWNAAKAKQFGSPGGM
jgi:hypothetical protein